MTKRIFLTGASGCIGHYVTEALIRETEHELYLLVRNPKKLGFNYRARPGIHLVQGDLRQIEQFGDLLKTMDAAILIATSWGGREEVFDVNVNKTLALVQQLDPERCEQVVYFSTASILNRDNQPLPQAAELGTDYIRSKYLCHQELQKLAIAPRITTLFPTLLIGGEPQVPYSHISSGIGQVARWIDVIRFLQADGSFHFIHGRDVAQVVQYLIEHPPELGDDHQFVLGNERITFNQAIEEACAYLHKRIYFRIPLTYSLADVIIRLFQIKIAEWDRFSMEYRHFTHQVVTNPASFGLPTYCATIADVLKLSGIRPRKAKR
jgi:nucleoside-diphosphate-sugar epimerase